MYSTTGVKRTIASALIPVVAALQASPDPLSQLLGVLLNGIAALFGVVGVVQAGAGGSILKYKIPTIGALCAVALFLIPVDSPWRHIVEQVSLIVAGGAVGSKVIQAGPTENATDEPQS